MNKIPHTHFPRSVMGITHRENAQEKGKKKLKSECKLQIYAPKVQKIAEREAKLWIQTISQRHVSGIMNQKLRKGVRNEGETERKKIRDKERSVDLSEKIINSAFSSACCWYIVNSVTTHLENSTWRTEGREREDGIACGYTFAGAISLCV